MPSLTGPEQHGPVETRGLGGVPWPLAQPLRHAPVRPTVESALRTGSAPEDSTLEPECLRSDDARTEAQTLLQIELPPRRERPARRRRGGGIEGRGKGR